MSDLETTFLPIGVSISTALTEIVRISEHKKKLKPSSKLRALEIRIGWIKTVMGLLAITCH